VLLIHGGPQARDALGWNPEVQFLANRGYAVLRLNFRGSAGYGRRFEQAGHRQWGLAMQDDVADAAKWLVEQGIADPERIAIYGASYGGYSALMGVIKNPDLFRCAVSLAGVTQIPKLLQREARLYGRTAKHLNLETVGDWIGDAEQLRRVSPAENAERVGAPVLIAHGDMDTVVDPDQAELMADALTRAGKPFERLVLEGEPHGLYFEATRLKFYAALESFLAKHLQARPEPPAPAPAGAPAS
jgi:dipeptidyl aminopeptidase/acylaminoacyl peptidase